MSVLNTTVMCDRLDLEALEMPSLPTSSTMCDFGQ
jgi:hypothetical protein